MNPTARPRNLKLPEHAAMRLDADRPIRRVRSSLDDFAARPINAPRAGGLEIATAGADAPLTPKAAARHREFCSRAPWFKPGPKVTLADGATYTFPKFKSIGRDHIALIRAVDSARDAGDQPGAIFAELALFAHMLRQNYTLAPEHVRAALRLDYSADPSPDDAAMRAALLAIAEGREPAPRQ